MGRKKTKKYPHIIHLLANGVPCGCCGKIEMPYLDGLCDAHTHGLDKFGSLELQMVLHYQPMDICHVLNSVSEKIIAGERYKDGDFIEGIFLDCPVRVSLAKDCEGVDILRVIIPDGQMRWPEDPECAYPYNMQTAPMEMMRRAGGAGCCS